LITSKLKHKYPVNPAVFHLLKAADSSQALEKTKLHLLLSTIPGCETRNCTRATTVQGHN